MRGLVFVALLLWLVSVPETALANMLEIKNMRYGMADHGVRVVLDINQSTPYRIFALDNPYRIVTDIPKAKWQHPKSGFLNGKVIKSYRSGDLDNGLTRIIFDLNQPALVTKAFNLPRNSMHPERLVIDLEPVSQNLFQARKDTVHGTKDLEAKAGAVAQPVTHHSEYARTQHAALEQASAAPPPPVRKPRQNEHRKFVVVIDPGHGGADPGAIQGHILEKHITLSTAQELKRLMEETGHYKVILTRESDVYIKLRDRLAFSRKHNADLFISLHADSIERTGVRGASIYTLSETASDKETARLAENENNSGFVAGVDLSQESQEVADILLDLAMREKMNESNMYARILKHALVSGEVRLLPNAHRSAGFAVLKAPDVPSVLIEIGFISNPKEANLLRSAQFQRKVAQAILAGTDSYFRKIKALQKL